MTSLFAFGFLLNFFRHRNDMNINLEHILKLSWGLGVSRCCLSVPLVIPLVMSNFLATMRLQRILRDDTSIFFGTNECQGSRKRLLGCNAMDAYDLN